MLAAGLSLAVFVSMAEAVERDAAPTPSTLDIVEVDRRAVTGMDALYRELAVTWKADGVDAARFTIHAVVMKAGGYRAEVVDQSEKSQGKAPTIAMLAEARHASVGINAGYFDKQFAPVGLYVLDGKTITPASRASPLSAVLGIDPEGALHIDPTGSAASYPNAIQAGPMLVDPGANMGIHGDQPESVANRTVLAIDTAGAVVVVSTTPVTLYKLAYVLQHNSAALGAMSIDRAINLDGGPSTSLSVLTAKGQVLRVEDWPVREGLIFSAARKVETSAQKPP